MDGLPSSDELVKDFWRLVVVFFACGITVGAGLMLLFLLIFER